MGHQSIIGGINPIRPIRGLSIGDEVIRLETDGTRCRIPDEVLQTYGGKTCYERYPDGTCRAYSFTVLYAPKPPDYIYTPELRSAMAAHDYIDMDGEKVHRKIKTVRIDGNTQIYGVSVDADANCCRIVFENALTPGIIGRKNEKVKSNIISDRLATISHADYWDNSLRASGINVYESLQAVCFRLHGRTDIDTKEKAKAYIAENPTTVYYEINPEDVADVTIPEPLQEWLQMEPGGTLEERVAVLEEIMQEAVMAVMTTKEEKGGD